MSTSIGNMVRKELNDIKFIDKIVNGGFLVKEEVFGLNGQEEILVANFEKQINIKTSEGEVIFAKASIGSDTTNQLVKGFEEYNKLSNIEKLYIDSLLVLATHNENKNQYYTTKEKHESDCDCTTCEIERRNNYDGSTNQALNEM